MTDQHRATPEQWASQKAWAVDDDDSACLIDLHARVEALCAHVAALREEMRDRTDTLAAADGDTTSSIFKVTSRIEALEAAQQDKLDRLIALDAADPTPDPTTPEPPPASAEAQPAGGLVERRLWEAMEEAGRRELWDNPHAEQAEFYQAMIREVAVHVRKHNPFFVLDTPIESDVWEAVAELLEREADRD
jgi:hypothetical protein